MKRVVEIIPYCKDGGVRTFRCLPFLLNAGMVPLVFYRPEWLLPAYMGLEGSRFRMTFHRVVQTDVEISCVS